MSNTDTATDSSFNNELQLVNLENRLTNLEHSRNNLRTRVAKLESQLEESRIVIENLKQMLNTLLSIVPEAKKVCEKEYEEALKEDK